MSEGKRMHPAVRAFLDADHEAIREVLDMNPSMRARLLDAFRIAEQRAVSAHIQAAAPSGVSALERALRRAQTDRHFTDEDLAQAHVELAALTAAAASARDREIALSGALNVLLGFVEGFARGDARLVHWLPESPTPHPYAERARKALSPQRAAGSEA